MISLNIHLHFVPASFRTWDIPRRGPVFRPETFCTSPRPWPCHSGPGRPLPTDCGSPVTDCNPLGQPGTQLQEELERNAIEKLIWRLILEKHYYVKIASPDIASLLSPRSIWIRAMLTRAAICVWRWVLGSLRPSSSIERMTEKMRKLSVLWPRLE